MNIKYKILGYSTDEHTVIVRYYTDITTEEDLDINLTLWDVPVLTGSELDKYISAHAPKQWFEILEKVKDPNVDTTLSTIKDLVGKERDFVSE